MRPQDLKAKWHKELDKDAVRESQMDEGRLERMPLHLWLALERDEIRLNKKERKANETA